jgi:F-type H+-transporting ATPase subunit b
MTLSNVGLLVLQEAEHATPGIFDINTGLSIWTLVIFLSLLAVLYKFAYPHILGAVETRERRIQEVLDAAARDRLEAERLLQEQRAQLAEGRQQVQQLLTEGRQSAERLRAELLEQARLEQEALLERTRQDLARERELAIAAVREEAVDISLAAASKLLERRLDAAEDRKLVRDYLQRVGAGNGGGLA